MSMIILILHRPLLICTYVILPHILVFKWLILLLNLTLRFVHTKAYNSVKCHTQK